MSGVAALDLGTNSTRFLAVGKDAEAITPADIIDRDTRVTRLGEGVDAEGVIRASAKRRVLEAVEDYDRRLTPREIEWVGGVATSACRRASGESREDLFEALRNRTGVRPELIDGKREAVLTYKGVRASLDVTSGTVLDIGGGSTEWISFDSFGLQSVESLPIGVVTLKERCVESDRYTEESLKCLDREVRQHFRPEGDGISPLIVVGGTGTTLGALEGALEEYRPEVVHGHRLSEATIERHVEAMSKRTFEDLSREPMIQPGREDVIVPGIKILQAGLDAAEAEGVTVSDLGVLTGYLSERVNS